MVEGRLAGLCPRPPAPEEIGPGTLVVLAPAAPPAELRALYRLCARALDVGRHQGREGL
ncbi:hypothetical protein OG885_12145 [Streptomyces sp. NBC_00028]|uniref:hypothetical protein n=1 Tax=Streptomyces sp. NBC_00028 TaxID=2975624 RepID=UPI00324E96C9